LSNLEILLQIKHKLELYNKQPNKVHVKAKHNNKYYTRSIKKTKKRTNQYIRWKA